MQKASISKNTLSSIGNMRLGYDMHIQNLKKSIQFMAQKGPKNITPEENDNIQKRAMSSQLEFLKRNDTPDGYYSEIFNNLDIDDIKDPREAMLSLSYPVSMLVGDGMKKFLISGLQGGRFFQSSGTTNPEARKSVYYDELSSILIREMNALGWQNASKVPIDSMHYLFMAPETAVYGMPFASLVGDMLVSYGANLYWGASFIDEPPIQKHPDFNIEYAIMNFKDNITPSKKGVMQFNIATKLSNKDGAVFGLIPAIYQAYINTKDFTGMKGFMAKMTPKLAAYGGGLKNQGVPPAIQAQGLDAVRQYFFEVNQKTGFDPEMMLDLYKSQGHDDRQTLDDMLTIYFNQVLEGAGIRCLNNFSAADMQPTIFPAGSLKELYGSQMTDTSSGVKKDIYVPVPGVAVKLLDPMTYEEIPRTELGVPGIMVVWNPFNIGHLQIPETEDIVQYARIPKTAPNNPLYSQGIGLQFISRNPGSDSGGIC